MWWLILNLSLSLALADSFRFHLLSEPHTFDFQTTASASGNYVYQNIYRGLFRYHSVKGLIKEGAKECKREPLGLTCTLNPNQRWSNGAPVKASEYVKSFQRLVTPMTKSPQVELLLSLKNAREIWAGTKPPEQLGVKAVDESTLRFEFAEEDPEFEFKLINAALTPYPPSGFLEREQASEMVTNGPYKITSWKLGNSVHLTANKEYRLPANPKRPDLEVYFLESDATALRLYEIGKMNFLRRLTSGEIPRYRDSKEFVQRPFARMEYMAFGPELVNHPDLREALSLALDYDGFLKLFDTKSPVGCPGVPSKFLDRVKCLKYSPVKARQLLAKEKNIPKLAFNYSSMGGEDMNRGAEWFQNQWKKNLNLSVELKPSEQIVYLRLLKSDPPTIFRKGVGLDRPTCLAAMELFTKGHPENYIHFDDPKYDKLVADLKAQTSESGRKVACRKASEYLIESHRILPLGEMYFTMLVSQKFRGWDLNELNHLDLTDLAETGL
jgi:oligopeptide transport system substrate-binding protein